MAVSASRTVSAPLVGERAQHARSGWCARPGWRWRSLPSLPMIRSPSQWPGTARSSTSAGRSLIMTMSGIWPRLLERGPGGGAGPGRCAGSGPAPGAARLGLARRATCRSSRATPASPGRRGTRARSRRRSAAATTAAPGRRSPADTTAGWTPAWSAWAGGRSRQRPAVRRHRPIAGRPPLLVHLPAHRRRRPAQPRGDRRERPSPAQAQRRSRPAPPATAAAPTGCHPSRRITPPSGPQHVDRPSPRNRSSCSRISLRAVPVAAN